jgi:hypothetical protein
LFIIDLCDQCIIRVVIVIRREYSQFSIIFVLTFQYRSHSVPLVNAAHGFCPWVRGGCIACRKGRGGFRCKVDPPPSGAPWATVLRLSDPKLWHSDLLKVNFNIILDLQVASRVRLLHPFHSACVSYPSNVCLRNESCHICLIFKLLELDCLTVTISIFRLI